VYKSFDFLLWIILKNYNSGFVMSRLIPDPKPATIKSNFIRPIKIYQGLTSNGKCNRDKDQPADGGLKLSTVLGGSV
jgi:hypothetical protein